MRKGINKEDDTMLRTIGRRVMRNRGLVSLVGGLVVLAAAGLWYWGMPPSSTLFGFAGNYVKGGQYSTIEVGATSSSGGCISIRNDNSQQITVTGHRSAGTGDGPSFWVGAGTGQLPPGAERAFGFTRDVRVTSSGGKMTLIETIRRSGGGCDNWLGLK